MPFLTAQSRSEPSRRVFWLLLGLILAASLGLRLHAIDTPQLWEDDYLNLDRALMDPARLIAVQQYQGPADTIFDFQPPLSYLLVHAALKVSDTVLAARAPALIAGMASILGMALLGARLGGRRAGLFAALLAGLALFHVEFSRAIKPYALFLCCQVFSLHFLALATDRRRPAALIGFSLATAAMLAAAYQGVPVLLAEALFVAVMFAARRGVFAGPDRWWRLGAILLAGDAAVLAWLPLAPGLLFIREFLDNPAVDPWRGLGLEFFNNILNGFFHQHAAVPLAVTLLLAVLVVLGAAAGRRATALLLLLAAGLPALVVLSSRSDLRPIVSWRHLASLFPALAVFAGCGASFLAGLIAGRLPQRGRITAALLLGTALCGLVMAPSLSGYDAAARRTLSNDRDLFRYLSRLPVSAANLAFTGYQRNARAFAARWHLPGRFAGPGDFDGPGYARTLVVDSFAAPSQRLRALPRGRLLASWRLGMFSTRVALAGLPRRAPLLLNPDADGSAAYGDDFRDWRAYADAWAMRNFTVDTEVRLLRPTRYEMPAQAVWRFDLPPGSVGATVRASVLAALYKRHPDKAADAALTVSASADGEDFTPVARIGHDDFLLPDGTPRTAPRRFFEEMAFYEDCREAVVRLDLSRFAAGGSVWLRVEYEPGVREGFLAVAGLAVTAETPDAAAPVDPLAFYAANLAKNCAAPAYGPGQALAGGAAYVFAAAGHPELAGAVPGGTVGTPADLAAFEAAHPDLPPAYVLRDAGGAPAVVVHDPALAGEDGGVFLADGAPPTTLDAVGGLDAGTVWLRGDIDAPTIAIGETRLPVPVTAPPGTVLRLTPGGRGTLAFTPDFDPPDFTDRPTAHFRNMAASASYPDYAGGVTCLPDTACSFDYVFVSGLPMIELRLMAYPRLYGDGSDQQSCRVAVSTDGKTFETVLDFREAGPGTWTEMFDRRFVRVRFDKPATFVTVRFSLVANALAEFWSPTRPVDRMAIEADLDARSLPPLRLPAGKLPVSLVPGRSGNAFRLTLDPARVGRERVWPGD